MSWKNIKLYRGFTLIELMIVIAIIGIMSAIGFSMWQSSKSDSYLRDAQREVASAIKMAQSYALQGRMQDGSVPYAYGVRFTDNANYEIFFKEASSSSPQGIESFILSHGIVYENFTSNNWVYFSVPFAVPNVNNISGPMRFKHGSKTKSISLSSNGVVTEN